MQEDRTSFIEDKKKISANLSTRNEAYLYSVSLLNGHEVNPYEAEEIYLENKNVKIHFISPELEKD